MDLHDKEEGKSFVLLSRQAGGVVEKKRSEYK
jgi:hypothetical protein